MGGAKSQGRYRMTPTGRGCDHQNVFVPGTIETSLLEREGQPGCVLPIIEKRSCIDRLLPPFLPNIWFPPNIFDKSTPVPGTNIQTGDRVSGGWSTYTCMKAAFMRPSIKYVRLEGRGSEKVWQFVTGEGSKSTWRHTFHFFFIPMNPIIESDV